VKFNGPNSPHAGDNTSQFVAVSVPDQDNEPIILNLDADPQTDKVMDDELLRDGFHRGPNVVLEEHAHEPLPATVVSILDAAADDFISYLGGPILHHEQTEESIEQIKAGQLQHRGIL
jgi:hypothetical protein